MYELIIIGGGPAGVSAGIYSARKKIRSLIITDSFGGQSIVSNKIENWIGSKEISGYELAKNLEEHLKSQEGIEIIDDDFVVSVEDAGGAFIVSTRSNRKFEAEYLLVASGSRRRELNIPGESKFKGRGVFYCAICDAPLMRNKNAVVVGGGNAGLEAVEDILPYASKIYLLEYSERLKGDAVTQEKIRGNSKVEIITMAEAVRIFGDKFVNGMDYKDRNTGAVKTLSVEGVFVEIGSVPNSDIVKNLVEINSANEIIVDPKTQKSSNDKIWAAGDVCDGLYKQNNIAVGDAIKAVLNIYDAIKNNKR